MDGETKTRGERSGQATWRVEEAHGTEAISGAPYSIEDSEFAVFSLPFSGCSTLDRVHDFKVLYLYFAVQLKGVSFFGTVTLAVNMRQYLCLDLALPLTLGIQGVHFMNYDAQCKGAQRSVLQTFQVTSAPRWI